MRHLAGIDAGARITGVRIVVFIVSQKWITFQSRRDKGKHTETKHRSHISFFGNIVSIGPHVSSHKYRVEVNRSCPIA
jgi:hypothetical protein